MTIDKSIKVIGNNHGNINSGDHVTQYNAITNEQSEKAFQDLFAEIEKLRDESQKEQAQFNAEQLKEALDSGDSTKAQKLVKFLQGTLGAAGSLATIAQLFGLSV